MNTKSQSLSPSGYLEEGGDEWVGGCGVIGLIENGGLWFNKLVFN